MKAWNHRKFSSLGWIVPYYRSIQEFDKRSNRKKRHEYEGVNYLKCGLPGSIVPLGFITLLKGIWISMCVGGFMQLHIVPQRINVCACVGACEPKDTGFTLHTRLMYNQIKFIY